ncbi:hypothetical protein MBLNU459_g2679t1 [Dothideomycetes sp. NU459]
MARSSVSRERVTVIRRFAWPMGWLIFWIIVILATGGLELGVFANFLSIQQQMGIGIPWLFPYAITVGALTIIFVIIILLMMGQNNLQPGAMLIGCFILIVLYITGLIETAIQLFGAGNVSSSCNTYVVNDKVTGVSIDTLAWLEQNSICNQWDATFAFWIVGLIFLIWMMVMASQVNNRRGSADYD